LAEILIDPDWCDHLDIHSFEHNPLEDLEIYNKTVYEVKQKYKMPRSVKLAQSQETTDNTKYDEMFPETDS